MPQGNTWDPWNPNNWWSGQYGPEWQRGSESSDYWTGYGNRGEQKYHWQKGLAGSFDPRGYTQWMPEGGIAPFAQYEAEKLIARRREELFRQASITRMQGLDVLGSYRPGGIAQMTSGLYEAQAQGLERYAADVLQPPDLLYRNRQAVERRAKQEARNAARVGAIGQGLGILAGAALGTAVPGIGTVAGGLLGGMLGGTASQAVTGKPQGGEQRVAGSQVGGQQQAPQAGPSGDGGAQRPSGVSGGQQAQPSPGGGGYGGPPGGVGPVPQGGGGGGGGGQQAPQTRPGGISTGRGVGGGGGGPGAVGGGGGVGLGMPMPASPTSVMDAPLGQEHLPVAVGSLLSDPMLGIQDGDILDFVLQYHPELVSPGWQDAMLTRLERLAAAYDPVTGTEDYLSYETFADKPFSSPVDFQPMGMGSGGGGSEWNVPPIE